MQVKKDDDSIKTVKTGIVADKRYQNHRATASHPERPQRIGILIETLNEYDRQGIVNIEPRPASDKELLSNHDRTLVDAVKATAGKVAFAFDPDTHTSPQTYETALLAVGGVLALVDAVMGGEVDNGFALVRPPGHHAESDRAMGFCFFNNVAIAARYLQVKHGLERVLVMDWDVHHGNGTQRSFYDTNSVMYISTHEDGNYPGTGALNEVGSGDGAGFTINIPFPPGFGDAEYIDAFHRVIEPVGRQFNPDFVLISAGFDHHRLDPLGGMMVTKKGIAAMTRSLLGVARDCCEGRCVALLEGGYSLTALEESVVTVLDELGGEASYDAPVSSGADAVIEAVQKTHRPYWKF